jgi:hypothetical protein
MNFQYTAGGLVSGGPNDGVVVSKTTDGGQTWTQTRATSIVADPGPILALPGGRVMFTVDDGNGKLFFVHSEDKGATWKQQEVGAGHGQLTDSFPQTFADRAGTLYVAWTEQAKNDTMVMYTFSKDGGVTWSNNTMVADEPGLGLFLWGAGGDAGRIGFSWYEAPDPAKAWYEHAAAVVGADTASPQVSHGRVSEQPARTGEPCQMGVACTSGRELGDFQQCAITPGGDLVVAYITVLDAQSGGRVTFARMAQGPKLVVSAADPWVV